MDYQLNDYGVFLKPELVEIDKYVIITLAERSGKWYFGYIYNYSLSFASSPCMEMITLGNNSRIQAIKSAINRLLYLIESDVERQQNHDYYKSDVKRMKSSLCNLKEYLFKITHVQLSLFD